MLYSGSFLTRASGSLGTITASHNRGGQYLRARVTPADPQTQRQQDVRDAMSMVSEHFSVSLTPAEIETWIQYAAVVPRYNALGARITMTAQQAFIHCNLLRALVGLAIVDVAPVVLSDAPLLEDFALDFVGGNGFFVRSSIDSGDTVVYSLGAPRNPSSFGYHGSYRITIVDAASPTAAIVNPWTPTAGQEQWAKAVVIKLDGRVSNATLRGPFAP
jgi:hypothetical protein